jgi:phosphoribosylanthranilate isomerase
MVSRTRVKVCGITRQRDAFDAIEAGADALGFVFYDKSPRAVSIEQAAEICRELPAFVTLTALFVDADEQRIRHVLGAVPIDLLQFHGAESPQECERYSTPYIKALRVKPGIDLVQQGARYQRAKALLLDAYKTGVPGGTGETFDWLLIPDSLKKPVILAGGLNSDNIATAIRQVRPYAVDVSGGVEQNKGIKDPLKIQAFIDEVGCADRY